MMNIIDKWGNKEEGGGRKQFMYVGANKTIHSWLNHFWAKRI
jgi:hypothetical protein